MEDSWEAVLIYFLSVTFWAVQAWFWSRVVLVYCYGTRRGKSWFERVVVSQIPRLLGTMAFLIAAFAAYYVAEETEMAIGSLIGASAFFTIVVVRRWIMGISRPDPSANVVGFQAISQDFGRLLPIMIMISGVIIIAAIMMAIFAPVLYGTEFGAGPVAFIALGSLIPIGSVLYILAFRRQFPLIAVIIILIAVFSLSNDNHMIRQLPEEPLRATPEAVFTQWNERLPETGAEDGHPLIIIATAGGGLRAAYWTTTILGAVQDHVPQFSDHIFAISGVSGGSLGAAVFTSLLAERKRLTCKDDSSPTATCFEQTGQAVLSRDFLGPTVLSLMYADLLQRLVPFPFLPDRAQALEEALEASWDKHVPEANGRLGGGFTALWREAATEGNWLPALLINGTLREDGNRVITSHMRINQINIFPSTWDFFETHCAPPKQEVEQQNQPSHSSPNGKVERERPPRDIRVTSAILNSARFPYITPAGTMRGCHKQSINHILDGGYFENFGALTALDILNWAVDEAKQEKVTIRPIVIQIVSDPDLRREKKPGERFRFSEQKTPRGPKEGDSFLSELRSPIEGIFQTRTARGALATRRLMDRMQELKEETQSRPYSGFIRDPHYIRLDMVGVQGQPNPSLGWVLSEESRTLIRNGLVCVKTNRNELLELLRVFDAEDVAQNGRLAKMTSCTGEAEAE